MGASGEGGLQPPNPQNLNLKSKDFEDMTSKVLRDLSIQPKPGTEIG
jgi:hypothetical protein